MVFRGKKIFRMNEPMKLEHCFAINLSVNSSEKKKNYRTLMLRTLRLMMIQENFLIFSFTKNEVIYFD